VPFALGMLIRTGVKSRGSDQTLPNCQPGNVDAIFNIPLVRGSPPHPTGLSCSSKYVETMADGGAVWVGESVHTYTQTISPLNIHL